MTGTAPSARRWLLRLVTSFTFSQGAVSMARPSVSYHALELGADARAVGVITAAFALLPLAVAVPLGRRTDRGRCGPLLPLGIVLIAAGCALSGTASSLGALAAWSAVLGLGHLVFVIGAQSLVARQSGPHEHDRNFGYFTIGGSMGQLIGPLLSGLLVGGAARHSAGAEGAFGHGSALALFASGALSVCAFVTLWRIENRPAGRRGTRTQDTRTQDTRTQDTRTPGKCEQAAPVEQDTGRGAGNVPVRGILRARGVPAGIFTSLAVLSTTDLLTAYLPVVGEERGIAPGVVGVLLSLRAAASVLSRLALSSMTRWMGREKLLVVTCVVSGALCVLLAVPVPVWALAGALLLLGFSLGVGQPLTMTTVVQAAPDSARSTALALRLTGNRLGQVAAPAGAGLLAGAAGAAAPFVMIGALLVAASGTAARSGAQTAPHSTDDGGADEGGADSSTDDSGTAGAREAGPGTDRGAGVGTG